MHAGLGKFSIQYLYLAICIASPVQEHTKKKIQYLSSWKLFILIL